MTPVLLGAATIVGACGSDGVTSAEGSLALERGSYSYSGLTRGDVALNGLLIVWYSGPDSLSGDMLAADPRGQPYFEGHFVASRQDDGSYRFEAPRSEFEPTGSRFIHSLRRTKDGMRCELRDERSGNSVTRSCQVGRVGE